MVDMLQALPGLLAFTLPLCDLCHSPTVIRGQWSPYRGYYVCRSCSESMPFPASFIGHEEDIEAVPVADREARVIGEDTIARARAERKAAHARPSRRPAPDAPRYVRSAHMPTPRQISLPTCSRCGEVHMNWGISDYADRCPRCEGMDIVDTHLRMFSLLVRHAGGDDDETILDWFYQREPKWFEGCDEYAAFMPDYYWTQRYKEVKKNE